MAGGWSVDYNYTRGQDACIWYSDNQWQCNLSHLINTQTLSYLKPIIILPPVSLIMSIRVNLTPFIYSLSFLISNHSLRELLILCFIYSTSEQSFQLIWPFVITIQFYLMCVCVSYHNPNFTYVNFTPINVLFQSLSPIYHCMMQTINTPSRKVTLF